jgi:methylglutaconyl-CoA hydratase
MTIDATTWCSADWAREKGLYTSIHDSVDELLEKLSNSNPEAMQLLRGVFWKGTEHWDELLSQRAELSGKLVLSDFTRSAISKFKSGKR